jgi:hypothetical protein
MKTTALCSMTLALFALFACSGEEDSTNSGGGGANPGGGVGPGGGATGIGGWDGNGGSTQTVGSCERSLGTCAAPEVRITNVDVGIPVSSYGRESDTEPFPMSIAAMPSGGSRLAWLGTDDNVYVAELDCNDQLVGTPFAIPGIDLGDIYADDQGGVVSVIREATNDGTDNCGGGTLCGGTSSPCRAMWLVRFDNVGNILWETQVTNLSDSLGGYDNGARFIWWYQHQARIASDGQNYAVYFGVAITVTGSGGSCIDIHQGDRMQVVDSSGNLVPRHEDAFEVGCSHAWSPRLLWDDRTSSFVMVCATDNNCRIARPSPYRTLAEGECNGTLFGGDVILGTEGYWVTWSQDDQVNLQHFTDDGPDFAVNGIGDSQHPHLVSYGQNNLLVGWGSGSGINAQVRDLATGQTVLSEFSIGVSDHDFQSFKAWADGSVAYPAAGDSSTSINVARVMPCQ